MRTPSCAQAADGFGWTSVSSSENEEDTSDADEWDFGADDGADRMAVTRRFRSSGSSGHGQSSTEDETLDDTGSDSEEDMEESRRLKWKRCRRHRPPMMEMWAAVRTFRLSSVSVPSRIDVHPKSNLRAVASRFQRQLP